MLWISSEMQGFDCNEWGSFNLRRDKKEMVAKGRRETMVIYYDTIEKQKEYEIKKIPIINSIIFPTAASFKNISHFERPQKTLIDRLEHVNRYILNRGAKVYHDGGNRAFYNRVIDDIHLPARYDFIQTKSMYSVTLHDIPIGPGKRADGAGNLENASGDKAYTFEG